MMVMYPSAIIGAVAENYPENLDGNGTLEDVAARPTSRTPYYLVWHPTEGILNTYHKIEGVRPSFNRTILPQSWYHRPKSSYTHPLADSLLESFKALIDRHMPCLS